VLFWYLAAFSYAHAQEFPVANGFTWEQVRFPSAFEEMEESNLIVEGAVEQGVDWFSLGDGLVFDTFWQLAYNADTAELDFNNEVKPAFGIKFKLLLTDWAVIEVGVKYEWEYRWITDRTFDGWAGSINWSARRTWARQVSSTRDVPFPAAYAVSMWGSFAIQAHRWPKKRRTPSLKAAPVATSPGGGSGAWRVSEPWWSSSTQLTRRPLTLTTSSSFLSAWCSRLPSRVGGIEFGGK